MMKIGRKCTFSILLFVLWSTFVWSWEIVHHDFQIRLMPEENRLEVQDKILLKPDAKEFFEFSLHSDLTMVSPSNFALQISTPAKVEPGNMQVAKRTYRFVPQKDTFYNDRLETTLQYEGKIRHPLLQQSAEYSRSFEETMGTIELQGVYLSKASSWYPQAGEKTVTFRMQLRIPISWQVISQGKEIENRLESAMRVISWDCPLPMDEIYLVGGPLQVYSRKSSLADAYVYLRTKDDALAAKYLEATENYLTMYSEMIGKYPFPKFALVENFWETGYGMPSFTLLGSTVIRLPFLLQSSYPHEILHNWWGNGVFVDYDRGNWCEGLTAYMADHLMKEMVGEGAEYRRQTLQRYRDFVRTKDDFPLVQFRSRHSPVTEAVGYGKSLMLFHELRNRLGDKVFLQSLREFYKLYQGKLAGFSDLEKVVSTVSGQNLARFFAERIQAPGACELALQDVKTSKTSQGVFLQFTLEQTQKEAAYELKVPVAVTLEGEEKAFYTTIPVKEKKEQVGILLPARPLRVDVDPEFDIFRKLDRSEIPSSVGQIFGAPEWGLAFSRDVSENEKQVYEGVLSQWSPARKASSHGVADFALLPQDRPLWILGEIFPEGWSKILLAQGIVLEPDTVTIAGRSFSRENHLVVFTLPHPEKEELAWGWIVGKRIEALPSLARKLPHYGKYSYLVFEGVEAKNVLKGQWPAAGSPLAARIATSSEAPSLPKRQPIWNAPSGPKGESIFAHVQFLAHPDRKGRWPGMAEMDEAARYIAEQFQKMGLKPGTREGFLQSWEAPLEGNPTPLKLANVVARVEGSQSKWAKAPIVIGAHYDHLGLGQTQTKPLYLGKIHPGADDNASGVAVMLECARYFAKNPQMRPIVFIAFTAEEVGLLGSKYFLSSLPSEERKQIFAMVNLDTVGRLFDQKLLILGCASAREWMHILMGCSYKTGVSLETVMHNEGGSDHLSFILEKIPAVQFFSGANLDYHTPQDTMEKIDKQGLAKVALVLQEAVLYLANREESLTTDENPNVRVHTNEKRKSSLGIIPDFTYSGKGLRIEGALPDSPAAKANFQKGDILSLLGKFEITNLLDLANALRFYAPGDKVKIVYSRKGEKKEIEVELGK